MTDMLSPATQAVDATAVRPGLLAVPGDAAYDESRVAWNLAVEQRPAAVALPTDADEVAEVVRHAAERGLRVTPQGTGHNAGPLGDLSDTILIRTHLMRRVQIDAPAMVARAEAGALWMDVVGPAAEFGLAALHGSAPDVGVVGYTLGGGISWYSRKYGTAASRVLAIEAVTAAGEQVRADRHRHADLFWALRGGGGSFAIVTAIEFELIAVGAIQAGGLWFDVDRASEVWHAWREWAPTLPDHVSTSVRVLNVPDMPGPPEAIRGKSFAIILVSVIGDEAEAERVLAPLRALEPAMDTVVRTQPKDMVHLAMDPPTPVPAVGVSAIIDDFTPEVVDAIVEQATSAKSLVVAYVTLGGGAQGRRQASAAMAGLDAPYAFFAAGIAPPPMKEMTEAEMGAVKAAVAPHASDRDYLNFAERATDLERFFGAETYARLREVKRAVDPEGRIRANHDIPA
jgi:FAD/FMN-containing dehydrogenase